MLNKIPKPVSSRGISSSTRGYVGVLNEIFDLPLGRGSRFPLSSLSPPDHIWLIEASV